MAGPASYNPNMSMTIPTPTPTLAARTNVVHAKILGEHAKRTKVAAAVFRSYIVQSGDTLSKIAGREYGNPDDWTMIYWNNTNVIKYANDIYVGQKLTIRPAWRYIPAAPAQLAPVPPAPKPVAVVETVQSTAPSAQQPNNSYSPSATYSGSGSMQSCIISRESGGNPNIWNASGHWGLYQFSYDTWVAHGGSGGSFGNSSIAEQNQIYYNTVAQDGYSDWKPYDGC